MKTEYNSILPTAHSGSFQYVNLKTKQHFTPLDFQRF